MMIYKSSWFPPSTTNKTNQKLKAPHLYSPVLWAAGPWLWETTPPLYQLHILLHLHTSERTDLVSDPQFLLPTLNDVTA